MRSTASTKVCTGGLFRGGDMFRLKANACGRMDLHGRTRQSQSKRHGDEPRGTRQRVQRSGPESVFSRYEPLDEMTTNT